MNNAERPLAQEVARVARHGCDFLDLTLEPPGAWPADGRDIRRLLDAHGLVAVGHTAPFLPIASPFRELRAQARALFRQACEVFAEAGVSLATVHPDDRGLARSEAAQRNAEAIALLAEEAAPLGVTVMVENLGRSFARPEDLAPIFAAAPGVRFHLDVGHANLHTGAGGGDRTEALLDAFGDRLAHVHVHDNLGLDDLHLPLGAGAIDWPAVARILAGAGWNGTVTLEVFAREQEHVASSLRLWLEWWSRAGAAAAAHASVG